MKLLRQIGEIVILLIVIVAIGGFILFAIAGVGAITGIQFIGNILMPTDENGRYLCAGLNAWDEGVCDTSQNTFGLNGINGMFAGAGFLLALAIIAGIVALGLGNYTGGKPTPSTRSCSPSSKRRSSSPRPYGSSAPTATHGR